VTSREARRSITPAPYFTVAKRAARGAAARADVPRRSHGDWAPSPHRPDPVELLEEQAADESPSSFRSVTGGCSRRRLCSSAAYLMASDLAGQPRSGLHAQLCGDAHLLNFGYYAAPDRKIVFDSNDFDETLPGPFEWDLKRLVASFAVVGRERGFDRSTRGAICQTVSRGLPEGDGRVRRAAADGGLVSAHRRRGRLLRAVPVHRRQEGRQAGREERREGSREGSSEAFSKLTEIVDRDPRLITDPPSPPPAQVRSMCRAATERRRP
jgi:hypothetical protein